MEEKITCLGNALREARERNGFSQEQMARMTSVSQSAYSRIERGVTVPERAFFEKAAGLLDEQIADWDAKIGSESPKSVLPRINAWYKGEGFGRTFRTIKRSAAARIYASGITKLKYKQLPGVVKIALWMYGASVVFDLVRGFLDGV